MKRNIKIVFGALMLSVCLAGCGSNSDNAELEKKVAELEAENASLREQLGQETENDDTNPSVDVSDTDIPEITVEASGVAGDDVTWEYGGGVLIFRGTGETTDFFCGDDYKFHRPYEEYVKSIVQVYFEDGITYIGSGVIYDMSSVSKVYIPESVKSIIIDSNYPLNLKELDLSHMNYIELHKVNDECFVKLPNDFDYCYLCNGDEAKYEWRGNIYEGEDAIKDALVTAGLYSKNNNSEFSTTTPFE